MPGIALMIFGDRAKNLILVLLVLIVAAAVIASGEYAFRLMTLLSNDPGGL